MMPTKGFGDIRYFWLNNVQWNINHGYGLLSFPERFLNLSSRGFVSWPDVFGDIILV